MSYAGGNDSVRARLTYLLEGSERPVTLITEEGGGESECSGRYAAFAVRIADARRVKPHPTLDREGFELRRHESAVSDFYDDEAVRGVYYPEIERLLEEATDAERVLVFDHNTRAEEGPRRAHANARSPVCLVHNDFTLRSAPLRVRKLLPAEEADSFLAGRFCIVNVWRPIRGPIESAPLALCDARSIRPGDLVAADLVYRHRTGEEYRSTFSADHRWYYFPRLERDEAVLIKVYGSARDGRARFGLHSAFDHPDTPADAAPRESIEVRAVAFFGDRRDAARKPPRAARRAE